MSDQKQAFSRALEATKKGDYERALREFIWLHDNPNLNDPSSEMYRRANGFHAWATLALEFAPAKEQMLRLLEQKRIHLQSHPEDTFVAADAGAMQQALQHYQ